MIKKSIQINYQEEALYNNILSLSRNKLFFTKFNLTDTFQNRIYLIFIHISFLFTKFKQDNQKKIYKIFYQKVFDLIFNRIELNMREIGYGDSVINKNMKFLVKAFYNILISCENFSKKSLNKLFLVVVLSIYIHKLSSVIPLVEGWPKTLTVSFLFDLLIIINFSLFSRYAIP